MWYLLIIILSVILAAFFMWALSDYKKQKKSTAKSGEKPPFRTEDTLEEYGKPLKDEEHSPVDFDDAQ